MEGLMWGFAALLLVLATSGTFAWVLAWRLGRSTRPATPKALNRKQALKQLRKNIRMDERWRPQGELLTGGLHRIPEEPALDGYCDCEDHD